MDFLPDNKIRKLIENLRQFVDNEILPLEKNPQNYDNHENIKPEILQIIRRKAKHARLWAPQAPRINGGLGLSLTQRAVFYEEANRSIFGPICFNCAAPDDGNISLLAKIATEKQKKQWMQPIIDGTVQSAFAMTEPHPGGGSDPNMIKTTAKKNKNKWIINGKKWFITGAENAQHFILIAKTSRTTKKNLTAFLFHKNQPGWKIIRRIPIMGPQEHGGHCEILFNGLEINDENILLNEGDGLKITQIRLGTARLTHAMRWIGLAKRTMEIATQYVTKRKAFGKKLAQRESVQIKLGEIAHDIHIARLLVMHAAWKLDQGDFARKEISSAKIHAAHILHKAADTAIQMNGARGYSKDTVLEWIYRYARQAKLVDGADEVHKMILAQFFLREQNQFWQWGVGDDNKT